MKSMKIAGLCLVAMFVVSMVASATASAALPEFVQCRNVGAGNGNWKDSQCSKPEVGGEWATRKGGEVGAETFSSTSGAGTLEPRGPLAGKITCTSDTDEGQITGPKEVGSVFIHFHGCVSSKTGKECETAGAGAGQINTNSVKGVLGFIKAPTEVGLRLEPTVAGGLFAEFSCSGITVKVQGKVIGVATPLNTMSTSGKLVYKQTKGSQEPLKFEGGAEEVLESNFGLGFEKSGIETSDTTTFQFDTEILA